MTKAQILACFMDINEELRKLGQRGEIGIIGGTVMCLVYNARNATRDVDAIFEPSGTIRQIAAKIGKRKGIGEHWLNDGAKGFLVSNFRREEVERFSNLLIWAPEARYMLAMKCISARWDTSDRDDAIFLIRHLAISTPKQVFEIIESYYPHNRIPPKTQFFIEEILAPPRTSGE